MNIVCLDQFGELGGAQRCLLDLLPALVDRGWRVLLAAPGDGQLLKHAAGLHATTAAIRCGPYSSGRKTMADMWRFAAETPRLAGEIRELARGHAAALIYVNGPRLLPAVALAARRGQLVVFHSHSLLSGIARQVAGYSLRLARAYVIASCRFVAAPLEPYVGSHGIRVIYNGVRRMVPVGRPIDGAGYRIGIIGRIAPEKGQADFLAAARKLHETMSDCRFVVCGAPLFSDPAAVRYATALKEMAEGLPVEFTGWREDVDRILSGLDLLVVSSTPVDATPRVILEAFAAGVPVLAFASGGIPELIESGATGFLVEQRSSHALAFAMRDALADPDRLRAVAERARAKASGEFSLERYQAQALETFAACAKR